MTNEECIRRYTDLMQDAKRALRGFDEIVAEHRLQNAITTDIRKTLEDAIAEYQTMLRDC
jgi:hypothetical protein